VVGRFRQFQAAERDFGGVDILINNAGVFKPIAFADVTEDSTTGS